MSPLLPRRSPIGVNRTFACGIMLVALAACHQRVHRANRPHQVERSTVAGNQAAGVNQRLPHFAGVALVRTSTGGFFVDILGGLVGQGDPLYVIDGHQMWVDRRRGIDWFKPDDIAHIRVLKTPAETAVYGANGGSGVVVITTKQNRARQ